MPPTNTPKRKCEKLWTLPEQDTRGGKSGEDTAQTPREDPGLLPAPDYEHHGRELEQPGQGLICNARGFHSFASFKTRLFSHLGDLELSPR